jgi:hypothetical protein
MAAYYSSYYADRPPKWAEFLNDQASFWGGNSKYLGYLRHPEYGYGAWLRKGWNDNSTLNSQNTASPIESKRHSMEADDESIGSDAARVRGQEYGWENVFKAAESGTPDAWSIGSDAAKSFGVGLHALQDSKPHDGTKMSGHNINKDMGRGREGKKAYADAMKITESALMVVEVLNGNFSNVKHGTSFDLSGMNEEQKKKFISALSKGNFSLK